MQQEKFDVFAIVELFGHQKIAGRCTEQNIAGTNMLRVDVPETPSHPGFSRLFGSAAIYAINPVDEVTCRAYAEKLEVKPIQVWEINEIIKKNQDKLLPAAVIKADPNDGIERMAEGVAIDDWPDDEDGAF